MISVGIDVAKDKHDCFIISSEGEVLADVFTIPNNMDGFTTCCKEFAPVPRLRTK
jgi:transposase